MVCSLDQERIFPWECDVYTKNKSRVDFFSACRFFFLAVSRLAKHKRSLSETLTRTCATVFMGIYLTYIIHGLDCDKTVRDCVFWDVQSYLAKSAVSQQISYEIEVHTQTALYPIPRYIRSHYIGSTVYNLHA